MRRVCIIATVALAVAVATASASWLQSCWRQAAMLPRQQAGEQDIAADAMVVHLKFDSPTGAYQEDSSGQGNHFYQESAALQPVISNGAAWFDGSKWMTNWLGGVGMNAGANGTNEFCLSLWVLKGAYPDNSSAVLSTPNTNKVPMVISLPSGAAENWGMEGPNWSPNYTGLGTGYWVHVVMSLGTGVSFDMTNGTILSYSDAYVGTTVPYTNKWYLGCSTTYGGGRAWKGWIDDVRIFNRRLYPTEASNLWIRERQ